MKFSFLNRFSVAALLLALVAAGCGDDTPITPVADYTEHLTSVGEGVIVPTYKALADQTTALSTALATLEADQTEANLEAARAAWRAARQPWEQSEGFLFGPVDQEGIDPSLDSWPVNVLDLNNVLNNGNPITPAFLASQEGTLKGFHTIEYLLWSEDGTKAIGDFTQREFEYLAACASVLADDASRLYDLWQPASGNFIRNLLTAGESSSIYISEKSALEELTSGLVGICDEVGNGKINDPYSQSDLSLEESRFSSNSRADFANNIRSIQHIYLGTFGTHDGKSLSDIVAAKNAALDTQIRTEIQTAIDKIEAIPVSFSDAVLNNRAAVGEAQAAVRTLQTTLEEQLEPMISGL